MVGAMAEEPRPRKAEEVYSEDRRRAQGRRVVGHGFIPWASSLWGENPREPGGRFEALLVIASVVGIVFLPVVVAIAALNPGPVATPIMFGAIALLIAAAVWLAYSWWRRRRSAPSLDEILRSRREGGS